MNTRIAMFLLTAAFTGMGQTAIDKTVHEGHGAGYGFGQGIGQACQIPDVDAHMSVLTPKLNLSPAQQEAIAALLKDQLAQLSSAHTGGAQIRRQAIGRITSSLTEEQKKKFNELRQDIKQRMADRKLRGQECSLVWNLPEE